MCRYAMVLFVDGDESQWIIYGDIELETLGEHADRICISEMIDKMIFKPLCISRIVDKPCALACRLSSNRIECHRAVNDKPLDDFHFII